MTLPGHHTSPTQSSNIYFTTCYTTKFIHPNITIILSNQSQLSEEYNTSGPYLVTHLNHTPIFEWCVVRCESKIGYQKDICLKEIQLHAHNLLAILN